MKQKASIAKIARKHGINLVKPFATPLCFTPTHLPHQKEVVQQRLKLVRLFTGNIAVTVALDIVDVHPERHQIGQTV